MAGPHKYRYPKTLLISMPCVLIRESEPLGLGYLAAYLRRHGFRCDILDANSNGRRRPSLLEIAKLAVKNRYDIIGITVFTSLFYETIKLAGYIKKRSPRAKIVLGGHHVTFTYKDLLSQYHCIDYIIRGEGEDTLLELIRNIREGAGFSLISGLAHRSKDGIKVNPPRPLIENIDALPFPARDTLSYKHNPGPRRAASVVTSRGCLHGCSFCSISAFYGSQPGPSYRSRSPAGVIEEIECLVRDFGIRGVFFKDDDMFTDAERLICITDRLFSRGMRLKYNLVARADDVVKNERYLPLLKKTGLVSVEVGIESGSEKMLKRFSKHTSAQINRRAVEILAKNRLGILLDYIMFEPYMSLRDFRENIDFIKGLGVEPFKNRGFAAESLLERLKIHPGTAYYRMAGEDKILSKNPFVPEWDFKDKDMRKLYGFIREYAYVLRKKISRARKQIWRRFREINAAEDKSDIIEKRTRKALLRYMDYELERSFLYLFERAAAVGRRYNFSRKGFLKVKSAVEEKLAGIKKRVML